MKNNIQYNGFEIFKLIWFHPRKIFNYIETHQYKKNISLLLFIGGAYDFLSRAIDKNLGDKIPLFAIIFITLFGGYIMGCIKYYVFSFIFSWIGKILKGNANTESYLKVFVYGSIPLTFSLLTIISSTLFFKIELFQSNTMILHNIPSEIIFYGTVALQTIFSIWSFILIVIGISEIQKFTIWKALLNLLTPILILLAIVMLYDFFTY